MLCGRSARRRPRAPAGVGQSLPQRTTREQGGRLMKLLLRVTPNAEHEYWCGHVLMQMDENCIKSLMAKRELFQMAAARDKSIVEIYFWSAIPTYYFEDGALDFDDCLTQTEIEVFGKKEMLVVPDNREGFVEIDESATTPVDC